MPGDASSTAVDRVPIVAVASGKGGAGLTTVAGHLALALAAAGKRDQSARSELD